MAKLPPSPYRHLRNLSLHKPTPLNATAISAGANNVENTVENVKEKPNPNSLRNLFLQKSSPLTATVVVENPIEKVNKKPNPNILRRRLFPQKPTAPIITSVAFPTGDDDAKNIVNQFKEKSTASHFRGNRGLYSTIVNRLAKSGHFSSIHDILDHQKMYPSIKKESFTARIIALYGDAKMFDHALRLFDEMPSLNCPRTVASFNALLTAAFHSRRLDKVIELFRELPGKLSIRPDGFSYTVVIKAFCKMRSWDEAMLMLKEMEKDGVEPTVNMFGHLFGAFCHHGRVSEVEKLWKLMEEKKVVPGFKCYNSLLLGMVNENRLSEAMEVLKVMEEKELKPNSATYNALVKGFLNEGNLEEVKKWHARMIDNGCVPYSFTFMTVIPFACDNNDTDFAYELCKKSFGLKVTLPREILQKVIDLLVEQSKADMAKELVELDEVKSGLVLDKLPQKECEP